MSRPSNKYKLWVHVEQMDRDGEPIDVEPVEPNSVNVPDLPDGEESLFTGEDAAMAAQNAAVHGPELLASLRDLENIISGKPHDRHEQVLLARAREVIQKAQA